MTDVLRSIHPMLLMLFSFMLGFLVCLLIAEYYLGDLQVQITEIKEWCEAIYEAPVYDK